MCNLIDQSARYQPSARIPSPFFSFAFSTISFITLFFISLVSTVRVIEPHSISPLPYTCPRMQVHVYSRVFLGVPICRPLQCARARIPHIPPAHPRERVKSFVARRRVDVL